MANLPATAQHTLLALHATSQFYVCVLSLRICSTFFHCVCFSALLFFLMCVCVFFKLQASRGESLMRWPSEDRGYSRPTSNTTNSSSRSADTSSSSINGNSGSHNNNNNSSSILNPPATGTASSAASSSGSQPPSSSSFDDGGSHSSGSSDGGDSRSGSVSSSLMR